MRRLIQSQLFEKNIPDATVDLIRKTKEAFCLPATRKISLCELSKI